MAMLAVEEALSRLLAKVAILPAETVPLERAIDRILAVPLTARRTQPPFDASAMDGYAVRAADLDPEGSPLRIIGESAAGHPFDGELSAGQAVRIFTGAPMPGGADTVLIQENAERVGGDALRPTQTEEKGRNVRLAGNDFAEGDPVLESGTRLDFAALSLAAAASYPDLRVYRQPKVAILATGDELKLPGEALAPGQIIASNSFGLAALVTDMGGIPVDLGIVPDDPEALAAAIEKARTAGVEIVVTLGGASVGDHDLVQQAMIDAGMELDFWKIAMRPGKPLMVGRLDNIHVLGLPGNPVSSMVCAHLFLRPLMARLQGAEHQSALEEAQLVAPLPANGNRQHYMRATAWRQDGAWKVEPAHSQDSSLISVMASSNALIVCPPGAPAADAGTTVSIDFWRQPFAR
ncbi:gephyrin-like molybdotransferase Glp [Notoacmeibacter marinus]|uniref:molybdopterin molybdotransferase MoeA n=1 Tax=Notoacmeibacter marinus TaxID=1876515 RepID=UPI000DF16E7C|nr:gephyrin-like molybdotransferase Glp [Notoacmeibacter marinus]